MTVLFIYSQIQRKIDTIKKISKGKNGHQNVNELKITFKRKGNCSIGLWFLLKLNLRAATGPLIMVFIKRP